MYINPVYVSQWFKKLMTDAVYTALKPKDKEYPESDVQVFICESLQKMVSLGNMDLKIILLS